MTDVTATLKQFGHARAYLATLYENYWIICFLFLIICQHRKNQQDQLIPSRDTSYQKILQYGWLRAFLAITPESKFS